MDITDESEPPTITVKEASRRLGISRELGYSLVRRGELSAVRLGRRIVVTADAVERIIRERSIATV